MQDELGVHTVTAATTTQYQMELVAGDLIIVDCLLTRVGGKSCTFTERMLHVDTRQVHATYETTEVFFDPKTRQSTEMPSVIRKALESQSGGNLDS
jgi:acyl-CoA thioester hydrolase